MSSLPISSKYRSQPHLPVSDAERDDLVRRLNQAFADGEVSSDDYQPLLDRVFGASTLGDLLPVVEQLPAQATFTTPAIVAQSSGPPPGELTTQRPANRAGIMVAAVAGVGVLLVVISLLLMLL